MAATIYIDVDDLPGRLGELGAWTRAGDRVLVTREAVAEMERLWALPADKREPSRWKQAPQATAVMEVA